MLNYLSNKYREHSNRLAKLAHINHVQAATTSVGTCTRLFIGFEGVSLHKRRTGSIGLNRTYSCAECVMYMRLS